MVRSPSAPNRRPSSDASRVACPAFGKKPQPTTGPQPSAPACARAPPALPRPRCAAAANLCSAPQPRRRPRPAVPALAAQPRRSAGDGRGARRRRLGPLPGPARHVSTAAVGWQPSTPQDPLRSQPPSPPQPAEMGSAHHPYAPSTGGSAARDAVRSLAQALRCWPGVGVGPSEGLQGD